MQAFPKEEIEVEIEMITEHNLVELLEVADICKDKVVLRVFMQMFLFLYGKSVEQHAESIAKDKD